MKKILLIVLFLTLLGSCIEIRQDVHIFVEDRDIEDQEEETNTEEDALDIDVEGELIK